MKTSELTGAALDWAVAKCEVMPADWSFSCSKTEARFLEIFTYQHESRKGYCYSRDWSLAGPIIERERIDLRGDGDGGWIAFDNLNPEQAGPTPLIAAMRCYVASKLGDEVTIPDELMEAE